jgi:hypothetical protein
MNEQQHYQLMHHNYPLVFLLLQVLMQPLLQEVGWWQVYPANLQTPLLLL